MIYFDNSATTRVHNDVAELVMNTMKEEYGNPSSLHHFGMDAYQIVGNARAQIANTLGAHTDAVLFTSNGTDSNNLAIFGSVYASFGRKKIVTTAIEHSSILEPMRQLEKEGYTVVYVKPNEKTHRIEAQDVIDQADEDTILVSVMHANNETGEILPIEKICEGVKKKDPQILVHTDCVQSYGKIPTPLYKMKVDLLSASGHKFHAPKGIGFLYVKHGVKLKKSAFGGSQERGFRPGTENVPGIAGIGLAADKAMLEMERNHRHVCEINNAFRTRILSEFPDAIINSTSDSIPYVLNISFPGYHSQDLITKLGMRDIYVSAGAACNKNTPSHVLEAMGLAPELVSSALRISFSEDNTLEEVNIFLDTLQELLKETEV